MLILAFDTTSERGGVELYRDHECLASVANEGPANIYSISLFEMVDRLFKVAGARHPGLAGTGTVPLLCLRDIELFAVANGPGSFTGIRVGVAAAQAWATATDRPVRGVSVLEAIVEEARPGADLAVPILDARRGEFFLALYRRSAECHNRAFEAEGEGLVLKPGALEKFLEEQTSGARAVPLGGITCLVREDDRAAQALREALSTSVRWQSVPGLLLGAIARLALKAYRKGSVLSPAELDAYYIRRPDAELQIQKVHRQDQEHKR